MLQQGSGVFLYYKQNILSNLKHAVGQQFIKHNKRASRKKTGSNIICRVNKDIISPVKIKFNLLCKYKGVTFIHYFTSSIKTCENASFLSLYFLYFSIAKTVTIILFLIMIISGTSNSQQLCNNEEVYRIYRKYHFQLLIQSNNTIQQKIIMLNRNTGKQKRTPKQTSLQQSRFQFKDKIEDSIGNSVVSQSELMKMPLLASEVEKRDISKQKIQKIQKTVAAMTYSKKLPYHIIYGTWDYRINGKNCLEVIKLSQLNSKRPYITSLPLVIEQPQMFQIAGTHYQMIKIGKIESFYPVSKIISAPHLFGLQEQEQRQIFATSSDCIQLYKITGQQYQDQHDLSCQIQPLTQLKNTMNQFNLPIPSFDWYDDKIAAVSLDGYLTLWDIRNEAITEQIQAHSKQVFDVSIHEAGRNILTSGADGKVKFFDLRDLKNKTIAYARQPGLPVVKVQWSQNDGESLFAIIEAYQKNIKVFDLKFMRSPLYQLRGHQGEINGISWDANGKKVLCSCGEDGNSFIWSLDGNEKCALYKFSVKYPFLNVTWPGLASDWIALSYDHKIIVYKI